MHNFYIPCSQQDKSQDPLQFQPRSFQSSFRRSASQPSKDAERRCSKASYALKNTTNNARSSYSEHYSSASPPSLGSSSPSSLEDETSPKTPSPGYCNSRSSQRSKESHVSKSDFSNLESAVAWPTRCMGSRAPSTNSACIARSLPSRLKRNDENQPFENASHNGQYDAAPPVIQETVVRSRLARDIKRTTSHEQQASNEVTTNVPNAVVSFNSSRCHARRRPCADAQALAPPKLKRDTDCTEALVRLIVCLSTKLVHAIWSQSAATPKTSAAFNGAGVLPLRVFIQETLRRSKTSYSTLQVALYYLILLKPHVNSYHSMQEQGVPACRALQCGRRMFLTALILASKYLQDRNYSSRAWSKISGLPISEINENERRYLNLIQFNLHMKKEAFENWSKITLSLCKIGEAGNLETMSMVSDAARVGSDDWWSYQLRRLTAELVQDSKQTDEYLSSLTANKTTDVSSEQLMASLDTPPSSPESVDDGVSENNIVKLLSRGSSDYFNCSKSVDSSSSPASSVPSRPSLPNLPTPLTTPRHNHVLPLPRGPFQPTSRCQASSQALLNLDKQAMNIANLDTCPPPKPRPCDLPRSMTYPTKRVPSNLGTALVASSLTCSPESTVSDVSCSTTRSRSSSVSSNSSLWFASGRQDFRAEPAGVTIAALKEDQPQSTRIANVPASYSFYHPTDRTSHRFEDEGIVINTSQASQPSSNSFAKFLDEGYGSDGRSEFANQKIANVLASLVTDGDRSNCSAATVGQPLSTGTDQVQRRHKRTHSSTTEPSVQDQVRQLMWTPQPSVDVFDGFPPMSLVTVDEKEVQHPEKEWAEFKRPVPNNMCNKRIAMQHCNDTAGNAAVQLAARFLCDTAMAN